MESIVKVKDNDLFLKDDYEDYNNRSLLNGKRRMPFKKFYIYKNNEIVIENNKQTGEIEILEKLPNKKIPNTYMIIYLDPVGRLSFMIMREHKILPDVKVLEKAESSPPHKILKFSFFRSLFIFGIIRFRYSNMLDVKIAIGYDKSLNYDFKYILPRFLRKIFSENTNKFSLLTQLGFCRVKLKDVLHKYEQSSEINNPIYIKSHTFDDLNYYYPLKFNGYDSYDKKHYIYSSRRYTIKKNRIQTFLRKSITGQLVLVVSDYLNKTVEIKEILAKLFTLITPKKSYDIYFEKFSSGASESAFEVFKYAKSQNDKKAVYILNKKHEKFKELQNHFGQDSIVAHNSIKSFYSIFNADKLISSDLSTHILRNLYDNSKNLKKVILNTNKKIFLQHGISLATNVFERGYYNKKVPIAPDYVVTNSKVESSYFMKYPKYKSDQLIQAGTPNLDLYVKEKEHSKNEISFLLTWRPWDLTGRIESNSYIDRYLQFLKLVKKEKFYDSKKINLILHPKAKLLLENQFNDIYESIQQFLYDGDIKDALLSSKVVITDYSSICFYAFAGGSNVVYFWGDKELAESEYGAPNILQKNNCFGDIAYDLEESLHEKIVKNYSIEQQEKYIEKFNELVEYTSGKNTQNVYRFIKSII
ncbi:CDP-glycerol glycerophosphotransferase family protein [Oceanobacillus sojae]|uniref:Uncharacterized protein n=1 Tax=Oceanobacillus sojae TaxID=582851 RepID=A0A511ZHL0_9BACI|nr:CDP-glycerol glycerophosphotransferase family protein [Oceanobacillus sojae]GEN86922.1 hypothetical protein OSO01_16610 [Oceanobacillus sojae]